MAIQNKAKAKKEQKGNELFEDPEALAQQLSKTEVFFKKNRLWISGVIVLIIIGTAGWFSYQYYIDNQNKIAQEDMFPAVFYFEKDSLNLALNGDGVNYGLIDIAEEYSRTDAGNLANFYIGAIKLKQGEFEEAIEYLEKFKAFDLIVQARAYSLIGDAYMELENFSEAASYYDKAAHYKPNEQFSPQYLMKAALAHEKNSAIDKAISRYQEIEEEFYEAPERQMATKYKAKLETMNSN